MTIVTASLIMSYSLFTLSNDKEDMVLTIPLVLYGMFYYLYIVKVKHSGGAPDEALYKERPILITVILYALYVIIARNV